MAEKIPTGKIVKILDRYRAVVNLGKEDGVQEGMIFLIYEVGEMISDPETGDDIENLELIKGRIKVEHVQNMIFVGKSCDTITRTISDYPYIAGFSQPKTEKVVKPLVEGEVQGTDYEVKVGDLVRQI